MEDSLRTGRQTETETQGVRLAAWKDETSSSKLGGLPKEGATEQSATVKESGN